MTKSFASKRVGICPHGEPCVHMGTHLQKAQATTCTDTCSWNFTNKNISCCALALHLCSVVYIRIPLGLSHGVLKTSQGFFIFYSFFLHLSTIYTVLYRNSSTWDIQHKKISNFSKSGISFFLQLQNKRKMQHRKSTKLFVLNEH